MGAQSITREPAREAGFLRPMTDFSRVPADWLDRAAPDVAPFIDQALARGRGEYRTEDILTAIADGRMQLWMASRAGAVIGVTVTQIITYPRKRAVHLLVVAGRDLDDWLPLGDDEITAFARRQGADHIEGHGRKGWARRLRSIGFEDAYTVVARDL